MKPTAHGRRWFRAGDLTATRDVYLELLCVLALSGLVLHQAGGWIASPLVIPSMPILFATAGAAVARDLQRAPLNPWPELGRHVRHLLIPLCALAIVAVPVTLSWGATPAASAEESTTPAAVQAVLPWLVPIAHVGSSAAPAPGWGPAQLYVSASLWLLLLSPALRWLFRRWPLRTLAVPFAGVLAAATTVWRPSGVGGGLLLSLLVFATSWMLGFALADDRIRSLAPSKVGAIALALMALAVCVAAAYPGSGGDIATVPQAYALWGTATLLLLLRLRPARSNLVLRWWVDGAVAVMSARALTVLLWTGPAIWLAAAMIDLVPFLRPGGTVSGLGRVALVAVSVMLIVVAVLAFGWIEDLATRPGFLVDARTRLQAWRRSAVALRGHVHRPPRVASVGGAMVGLLGLAVAILPPAAAGPEPADRTGVVRTLEHDHRPSPVDSKPFHSKAWSLGVGVTGSVTEGGGGGARP